MRKEELRYLQRLAEIYPTIGKASTEIINLQSILNLPKGTEHFMSDLHGEYQAFSHVLRNGSGAVRKKIDDVFGHTLSNNDKRSLATLIYYPKEKMDLVKETEEDMENWYKITLYRLIEICKTTASKYTRSKVRKALPADYAYVIEELITEKAEVLDKEAYYDSIVNTIIEIGGAEDFIIALAELMWERAGKPEPETMSDENLYSDLSAEDEDAQKAARWAVEQELLKDDTSEDEQKFHPAFPVSKLRVCLTWNAAKKMGLFENTGE